MTRFAPDRAVLAAHRLAAPSAVVKGLPIIRPGLEAGLTGLQILSSSSICPLCPLCLRGGSALPELPGLLERLGSGFGLFPQY